MSTREQRLRATTLANTQDDDTGEDQAGYTHDDVPVTRGDAAPGYSAARERMLAYFRELSATPVKTGE
jgi:hypothetical protein